jgi:heme A synthase
MVLIAFGRMLDEEQIDAASTWPNAALAGRWLIGGVCAQVVIGSLNIALAAPGWLQIVHLILAQAAWLALVLAVFWRGVSDV